MVMCGNGMFGRANPNERATRPADWTHAAVDTQPSILFKFHHIISWDCLRDTWQGLLEYSQWDALESYMFSVGVLNASAIRGKLHRAEDLGNEVLGPLFEKISWPGWNIVQGPGNRSDEGGSDVDLFENGMSSTDKSRMSSLSLLWVAMSNFLSKLDRPAMKARRDVTNSAMLNAQPVTVTKASHDIKASDAAAKLGVAFRKMAAFKDVSYLPYIHSMWDTVSSGAVNKNAVGVWDATPQFRKAEAIRLTIGNMPKNMRCTLCEKTYERPVVPPRTKIWCRSCGKQTLVDFANAAPD